MDVTRERIAAIQARADEVLALCVQAARAVDPPGPVEIGGGMVDVPRFCECGRLTIAVVEYVLDGVTMFWRAACEEHAGPIAVSVTIS